MRLLRALAKVALVAALLAPAAEEGARWRGVDETVVEKTARAAGREPSPPLINTEGGDLQLFLFLAAGALGGFIAGYYFRELFPPRRNKTGEVRHV